MHDRDTFFNSEQTKNLSQHFEKVSISSVYSHQLLSIFLANLSLPYDSGQSKLPCRFVLIKSAPKLLRRILRRVPRTLYGKNIFVLQLPYHLTQSDGINPMSICVGKRTAKRVRRRLTVN